ncbi:MAG TPA: glycoside hydrolase family 25 protein [Chitinophagaceae bacterium]|nr:glycoside hydrolase family 25 protein [Chitinophagaceae bacterium]
MPSKKKSRENIIKWVVFGTALAGVIFVGYIGYLWSTTREVNFVKYKEFGIPMPTAYEIHGIDVSRYQQRIAWDAVKKMEVSNIKVGFAFIKATEGNGRVDPFFKRNWERSKKAGIVRGAYHFFIASKDGKTQALNFAENVKLESGDLPPVLDIEQTNGQPAPVIRREIKKWLDALEVYYAVKPVIYTNADFYKTYLQGHFDEYPLWVAHYLQLHQPRIKRAWTFWQHSEKGRVNGIYSKVDFNVFNGDSAAFKSLLVP